MKKNILIIILLIPIIANCQSNISAKLSTIVVNPFEDPNKPIYINKIDNDGLLTIEPGLQLSAEFFTYESTSIKIIQTFSNDQINYMDFSTQLLIRVILYREKRNSLLIGFGPIIHFRQNWNTFPNYQSEGIYKQTGDLQYKFSWISGEIEYNYLINRNFDLSVSANHFHPQAFGLLIGGKYWFSRKSRHCNTCPSYN